MDDFAQGPEGTVDPEVRAYVTSLVTAIGGTGSYEDGRYVLGDDALACLRDLKRWLRLYDEKLNRLDVARVLAERDLVKGDLLEILAGWPEEATEDRVKSKIALACFELLVPLTWPLEKNEEQATANHYRNVPYLQLAHISYKREVLEHPSAAILRAAVRAALPSLALASGDRTQRDEGIIKLILYFFRNIAIISAPENLPVEWNENEVSRSATIDAFHKQDILPLLLTIASNIEDFGNQDVVLLEILFHLFKGVDVSKLFLNEEQLEAKHSSELKDEMLREASLLRGHAKTAPTRHNRFGTMIWVKRDGGRGVSCVSGQDVLSDPQHALKKMDQSKKYNRPGRRSKEERSSNNFGVLTPLTNSSTQHLRTFVEEFLDSGFNPLMYHLRRAIEREAERVLEVHSHQYFYLIAWCLEAERARRKCQMETAARKGETMEPENFGLVASVLNQETFILLNRYMEDRFDHKLWLDLNAGMRSFIQILLTVQDMAESSLDEDQEIADNIQNRIFYEETTHDRVLAILRGFKDQGFSYLDACTELAHVFLRLLERYSKQNLDLQVRSRHRSRKKHKTDTQKLPEGEEEAAADSDAEEIAEAQRVSRERKFDFGRFAAKFVTQGSVDTFTTLLTFYNDLSAEQLKRVHRFLYRVAFKQDMSVILFRVDVIHLLYQLVRGPNKLDKSNKAFAEWEEFSKQIFRRFIKKLHDRPALAVEVLFSKIQSTAYYLEYGYEKQTVASRPRAPAELEVKGTLSREDQIGVVVAALGEAQLNVVNFIIKTLESAGNERQSWEAEAESRREVEGLDIMGDVVAPSIPIRPDNEEIRLGMFKNNKFRLLLSLCGCQRSGDPDDPDAIWVIPSELTAGQLRATAALIETHRLNPKLNYAADPNDEPISPEQLLRRKTNTTANKRNGEIDWGADDSDADSFLANDDEPLFPVGGPTPRVPDALAELRRARRKRKRDSNDEEPRELDESLLKARRKARLLADLEKRRKIKSTEFVRFSDDEDDEEADAEFFAAEARRRREHARKLDAELEARREADPGKSTKRALSVSTQSDDSEPVEREEPTHDPKRIRLSSEIDSGDGEQEQRIDQEEDTPPSSQTSQSSQAINKSSPAPGRQTEVEEGSNGKVITQLTSPVKEMRMTSSLQDHSDEEEEEIISRPSDRRARLAVLDDSDED